MLIPLPPTKSTAPPARAPGVVGRAANLARGPALAAMLVAVAVGGLPHPAQAHHANAGAAVALGILGGVVAGAIVAAAAPPAYSAPPAYYPPPTGYYYAPAPGYYPTPQPYSGVAYGYPGYAYP